MIAKDILSDIYAEKETGIYKKYDLNFSEETNNVINKTIKALNNNFQDKIAKENKLQDKTVQKAIAPLNKEIKTLKMYK